MAKSMKRGSTWTAVWYVDRRQRTKGGFPTKRAADAHAAQQVIDLHKGTYNEPTKTTLNEWVVRWLPAIRSEIGAKTWINYESALRRHVLPRLGDVALARLTKAQVKTVVADLLGRGYARGSVQQVVIALHRALKDAVAWGEVGLIQNAADGLASGLVSPRRPPKVWTGDEARRFLDHCAAVGNRWRAAFALDLATGLRRGELLGLRWDAHMFLDGPRPYLLVEDNATRIKGQRVVSSPKTEAGRRMVTLDPDTVAVLRVHREVHQLERMAAGSAWQEYGLVFAQEDGTPINPDMVSESFARAVRAAGVPELPLKNLRHTHATLGLAAGEHLKVMSKRLGHTSISITGDIYTHVQSDQDQDAANRIGRLIYGEHPCV